jgi:hypothetical protein
MTKSLTPLIAAATLASATSAVPTTGDARCLIFPISVVRAQIAPDAIEMATGDVWSSTEELIYVPREALELPTPISPGDMEMATAMSGPLERIRSTRHKRF